MRIAPEIRWVGSRDIMAAGRDRVENLKGKTILQLIPQLNVGGAERTTVDIAEALVAAGACALVASEGGGLVGELQAKGGLFLPFPAATKNPLKMFQNRNRLIALCLTEKVDLIHARSRAPAWSALGAARHLGIPFVTTVHGNHSSGSPFKRFYNSIMARGDAVIANSERTAEWILAHYPEARDRMVTIPRGTDLKGFSPEAVDTPRRDALRKAWALPEGKRVILLGARITPLKGHLVALAAFRAVLDRGLTDVVMVFAGGAQGREAYAAELDRAIQAMGLSESVFRVGHCADMPAAYALADVVIMPSIEPEGFGRTAVEAQAMGKAVIASDLGATPGTILPRYANEASEFTGWVVPAIDPTELANAVTEALALPIDAREALGARARRYVEARYSLRGMTDATITVYQSLFNHEHRLR